MKEVPESSGPTPDDLRLAGNQAFIKKDYDTSIMMYTMAIENHKTMHGGANGPHPLFVPKADPATAEGEGSSAEAKKPTLADMDVVPESTLDVHFANRSLV